MSLEKMGPSPKNMGVEPKQQDRKAYREQTTVNGIRINVAWDSGYRDYTLDFPQIDLGYATKNEPGVCQAMRITRNPEIAKQIFDFAVKKAGEINNVYDLYREVKKFSKDLPYEDEE